MAFRFEAVRHFSDGCGFANAVDADKKPHGEAAGIKFECGGLSAEHFDDAALEIIARGFVTGHLTAFGALAQFGNQLGSRGNRNIRQNQAFFEFIEQIVVEAASERASNALKKSFEHKN